MCWCLNGITWFLFHFNRCCHLSNLNIPRKTWMQKRAPPWLSARSGRTSAFQELIEILIQFQIELKFNFTCYNQIIIGQEDIRCRAVMCMCGNAYLAPTSDRNILSIGIETLALCPTSQHVILLNVISFHTWNIIQSHSTHPICSVVKGQLIYPQECTSKCERVQICLPVQMKQTLPIKENKSNTCSEQHSRPLAGHHSSILSPSPSRSVRFETSFACPLQIESLFCSCSIFDVVQITGYGVQRSHYTYSII